MLTYSYSKGDLLDSPNTYFYIQYAGDGFLECWTKERERVYSLLGQAVKPPKAKGIISLEALLKKIDKKEAVDTHTVLETLYKYILKHNAKERKMLQPLADKVLTKFETAKRMYESYKPGFLAPAGSSYRNMYLYIRTAEIFEFAYKKFSDIRYMNALLKCIDTLCSVRGLLDSGLKGRLAFLILQEKYHVGALARSIGARA